MSRLSNSPSPIVQYSLGQDSFPVEAEGPFRSVIFKGRRGILAESIHSRISIKNHSINSSRGSFTLWVMSRDTLCSWSSVAGAKTLEPSYTDYVLLAGQGAEERRTCANAAGDPCFGGLRDWENAAFSLVWNAAWYPQFFAKWCKGPIYGDGGMYSTIPPYSKPFCATGHWQVHKEVWYQIAVTWDADRADYRVYLNGTLAGVSNRFGGGKPELCDHPLVAGNTNFIISDLDFYDEALSSDEIGNIYSREVTFPEPKIDASLRKIFAGVDIPTFEYSPDESWSERLSTSLKSASDLEHFQIQGFHSAQVNIEAEGLRVCTPQNFVKSAENLQMAQGYLWTREFFEGDQYLEFEFMPLRENGLALLCLQAAGMQGEDFMSDYPLRVDGSMSLVHGENVRLYHWEFFREMDDTRNDTATSALIKQPWQHPLAYQCLPERLALNRWYRLQFLQEDNRLRGAIDSQTVFDVMDDESSGQGPVFRRGRLGLRLMYKSEIRFRNLKVCSKSSCI